MNFKKAGIRNFILIYFLLTVFVGCKKEHSEPAPIISSDKVGMFVLNQGGYNENNASLSYYNFKTGMLTLDTFKNANNRGLGDVANDMQVYGSKMYIIVNLSGNLEVVDSKTAQSIKQIPLKNGDTNRQPRKIVFNNGKAFISLFDGHVAVLDTVSLTVEKYIAVGRNPEGMAIANGKLYVANSGGLSFPNFDTSVSVIDLSTLEEIKKITVTMNPNEVVTDAYGDIYVKSNGNYNEINPALTIINSSTDLISKTINNFDGINFTVVGNIAYYANSANAIKIFDVVTEEVLDKEFITDGTTLSLPYAIKADENHQEIYITDAINYGGSNGKLYCFDKNGNKKYELTLGLFPDKIHFLN